jgi:hypothetical protein
VFLLEEKNWEKESVDLSQFEFPKLCGPLVFTSTGVTKTLTRITYMQEHLKDKHIQTEK